MIELEVYATGVRDRNKIFELEHQIEVGLGLRHNIDSNRDIEKPTIFFREIRSIFLKLGLKPHFFGAIPTNAQLAGA